MLNAAQVELPILTQLKALGVNALECLQGVDLFAIFEGNQHHHQVRGARLMNLLGMAFRRWCQSRNIENIEKPPATRDLHMFGRGPNDTANAYPTLDSNIKAAHTKPILFFLADLAREIGSQCHCTLEKESVFHNEVPICLGW